MSALVVNGDARSLSFLADESVDLVVTSPPYWAQRSYREDGEHYEGQIGSEPHPRLWLEAMWDCAREWWRVLKPSGSVFVNLGDKRAGSGGGNDNTGLGNPRGDQSNPVDRFSAPRRYQQTHFGRVKSRQLLPERFAIGMEDGLGDPKGLGWIVRGVGPGEVVSPQIWHKANGLPESVTDRWRDDFEYIFHFTKSERYYSAVDEIREGYSPGTAQRYASGYGVGDYEGAQIGKGYTNGDGGPSAVNPLGKLPGSVWRIASEPLRIPMHFVEDDRGWRVFGNPAGSEKAKRRERELLWAYFEQRAREGCQWGRYGDVSHFACVDEETEILTRRGWLRHGNLVVGDEVAGYDLDTGLARWTTCHAINRYPFNGELVSVEKRDLSMRLTPNHRCVAAKKTGAHPKRGPLRVVNADVLTPDHFIPRSAEWENFGEKSIGEDMAALCGWVAAEGTYTSSGQVRLCQSLTANRLHVETIDALLWQIGAGSVDLGRNVYGSRGKWRARVQRNLKKINLGTFETEVEARVAVMAWRWHQGLDHGYRVVRHRTYLGRPDEIVEWRLPPAVAQEIRNLMPAKRLGMWALELPEDERRALLEAFIDGDGHRRSDGRIGIFQKERENLDVLQAIAVTLAYKTTLRRGSDKWVLYVTAGLRSITLRGTNGSRELIPREHYRGIVWCPTTGTGTFIARRRGSVFITGNSFPSELPRRLILGWSPPAMCLRCGEGRRPVVAKSLGTKERETPRYSPAATIVGYACACTPFTDHAASGTTRKEPKENGQPPRSASRTPAHSSGYEPVGPWREWHLDGWTPPPSRPAVVLDPFCGTGTTLGMAQALGRNAIGTDLSKDYCRLARWRISQPSQWAKATARSWAEAQGVLL